MLLLSISRRIPCSVVSSRSSTFLTTTKHTTRLALSSFSIASTDAVVASPRLLVSSAITSARWISSSNDNDATTTTTTNTTTPTPLHIPHDLHYTAPLADLISRLKMVSITGCFLSVIVMPALVFLKNGDLPNAQQASMGGVATFGAVTSTAALHFVFGAYVLDMKVIDDSDDEETGQQQWVLLEATTRSIFGFTKVTHLFDPYTDVGIYKGNRPFANFTARGVPLYVHPERLDDTTRKLLLQGGGGILSKQEEQHDSEGLSKSNSKTKKDDDDDELF